MATMATACLFFGAWLVLPTVHDVHALAVDSQPDSDGLLHAQTTPCSQDEPGYPFEVDNAFVTGIASAAEQAALHAEEDGADTRAYALPQRSLLHGNRKPSKYSVCNRCTIVTCNQDTCSGHCKKNRKVFYCQKRRRDRRCTDPKPEDLPELQIDSLGDYDSAIVTVPAPYIGCAQITGKTATGCPKRFTRADLPGGGRVTVLGSECVAERYLPPCPGPTPLFPFGICECRTVVTRPKLRIERGPCNITQLTGGIGTLAPPRGRRRAAEPEVVVETDGAVVTTGFIDYIEDGREPTYVVSRDAGVGEGDMKLEIFEVETLEIDLSQDYNVLYEEEGVEYDEEEGDEEGDGPDGGDSGRPGGPFTSTTSTSTSTTTTSWG